MPAEQASDAAIELVDLRKTYADGKQALKGVSLTIPHGSILGLLGPNGAGKSTLINILAGLVRKSSGEARASCPLRDRRRAAGADARSILPRTGSA